MSVSSLFGLKGWMDFFSNLEDLGERMRDKVIDGAGSFISDNKLPDDIQEIVAQGQYSRAVREINPQFAPWRENEPAYKARKGNKPVGILTGEMLSYENIFGKVQVTKNTITIRYAGSAAARRKVRWFEEGGRRMWGLDPEIRAKIMARMKDHIAYNLHGGKTVNVR
jgi:hypothetical protein